MGSGASTAGGEQTVLLTGGSKGIGLAVARALAQRGTRLILVARGAEGLERACSSLPGEGHCWHAFDVSDSDGWLRHVGEIERLRGLVCAAAILAPVGPVGSYSPAEFRQTIDVNLFGTFLAIHHCLPALRIGTGSIVTFGGGGATSPFARYDAYAASKAAVARLTENLATELAACSIPINCVSPGFIATQMHEVTFAAGPERAGEAYFARTKEGVATGGFPASEAAELVCALLAGVSFTGKLVSAQWDPWRDPDFQERLAADPDFATLRRIDAMQFERLPRHA